MPRLSDYKPTELHPGMMTRRRFKSDAERDEIIEEAVKAMSRAETYQALGAAAMGVIVAGAERAGALAI